MLRGSVAHSALHKFYAGLPKELGHDRVTPENVERAVGFLRRCLDDALRGGVRLELTELQAAELEESLWRDLEGFVRDEARSPLQLAPRRFEVGFGSDRSAPELQRGLPLGDGLHLSGKIDRIDVDPFSARGIVQDYKSGRTVALGEADRRGAEAADPALHARAARPRRHRAARRRLPRARRRARHARPAARRRRRGPARASRRTTTSTTTTFWALVETSRERARGYAQRIRAGDVKHDPKGGTCPSWCDLWTMCRIERA